MNPPTQASAAQQKFELAKQHFLAGRWQQAQSLLEEVRRAHPDHADVLQLLGVVYYQTGWAEESLPLLQRAVELDPSRADFLCNLGLILNDNGQKPQAIEMFRRALKLRPNMAPAWNNLGVLLEAAGKRDEALAALRRALELQPNYPEAYNNLGNSLHADGRPDDAVAAYRKAIAQQPKYAQAHNNLSNTLREKGLADEALSAAEQAVALRPDYPEAHVTLGNILQDFDRLDEACEHFRKALSLRPTFAGAAYNLANALHSGKHFEESIAAYRQAIALRGDYADAQHNLANALKDIGQLDAAIASYDRALAIQPDHAGAGGARLYTVCFHEKYDSAAILQDALEWNRRHAEPLKSEIRPHANNRNPNRRLRIGYISPDFRQHCQAFFTIPLLSNHDHQNFEIYAYSDVQKPDEITRRLQGYADRWQSTSGLKDPEVAEKIRTDQIDILIDLTMHMSGGRPLAFARKPAPIQIAWLAYPGTTGLSTMDYRLTDPYLDPVDSNDANYSEQSIRLPHSFWCYDPLSNGPAVNSLPAFSAGFITFGCLNNFCKATDSTLALWSRVLHMLPNSRLILLAPMEARDRVLKLLDVESNRVEFVDFQARPKYLETYHRIDLGLDTFPYNGHTTSLDSLWMGVPVISLMGETVVSRAGLSQASNLGLADELVAKDPDQFVEIAKKLSGDLNRLAELRSTLRDKMERSPLMDGGRFARDMESVYRKIWTTWCPKF